MAKCDDRLYMRFQNDEIINGFAENTYMELDPERWQTKVIEIFKNGDIAYAYDNTEHNTFLAEAQYPEPYEINGVEGYDGCCLQYISKEEFFEIWNRYVS